MCLLLLVVLLVVWWVWFVGMVIGLLRLWWLNDYFVGLVCLEKSGW